jgi:hypothetical protein
MIDINQVRALIAALHTIKEQLDYEHAFYHDVFSAIYALNNIDKTYKAVAEMQTKEVEVA